MHAGYGHVRRDAAYVCGYGDAELLSARAVPLDVALSSSMGALNQWELASNI